MRRVFLCGRRMLPLKGAARCAAPGAALRFRRYAASTALRAPTRTSPRGPPFSMGAARCAAPGVTLRFRRYAASTALRAPTRTSPRGPPFSMGAARCAAPGATLRFRRYAASTALRAPTRTSPRGPPVFNGRPFCCLASSTIARKYACTRGVARQFRMERRRENVALRAPSRRDRPRAASSSTVGADALDPRRANEDRRETAAARAPAIAGRLRPIRSAGRTRCAEP